MLRRESWSYCRWLSREEVIVVLLFLRLFSGRDNYFAFFGSCVDDRYNGAFSNHKYWFEFIIWINHVKLVPILNHELLDVAH